MYLHELHGHSEHLLDRLEILELVRVQVMIDLLDLHEPIAAARAGERY